MAKSKDANPATEFAPRQSESRLLLNQETRCPKTLSRVHGRVRNSAGKNLIDKS